MSKIIVRRQEYANNGTHANEIESVVKQNLIVNTLSSALDVAPSVGLLKSKTDEIESKMQCGSISVTLSGSPESKDVTVTFPHAFSSSPIVVASINDAARGATSGAPKTSVGVFGITNTTATFRIKTDTIISGDVNVFWIAMIN